MFVSMRLGARPTFERENKTPAVRDGRGYCGGWCEASRSLVSRQGPARANKAQRSGSHKTIL
jgi:hypothetical protein